MKKIPIILLLCSLMTNLGLAQSAENPERTKIIYRGSKYRPSRSIMFFDRLESPHGPLTGWMAKFVEYKILGRTRYVGGLEYLTEEQRQDENTVLIELTYFFLPESQEENQEKIIIAMINARDKEKILRITLCDKDLDGYPDGCLRYTWVPGFDAKTPDLLFEREIEKEHIKWFKKIKKQIDFEKIQKEFQEWLKEKEGGQNDRND